MKNRFAPWFWAIAGRRSRRAGAVDSVRRENERSEVRTERKEAEFPAVAPRARKSPVTRLKRRFNRLSFLIHVLGGQNAKNRQNLVLSLSDDQQEMREGASRYEHLHNGLCPLCGAAPLSVAGYAVTPVLAAFPNPLPPYKTGVEVLFEIPAFFFLATFFNNLLFFKS